MVVMCKVNPKTNMLTFITEKDRQVFKMIQRDVRGMLKELL